MFNYKCTFSVMYNTLGIHNLFKRFFFYTFPLSRRPSTTKSHHQTIFKPPPHKTKDSLTKLSARRFLPCFKVIGKQFTFYKIKPHFNLITLEILGTVAQQSGFRNPGRQKEADFEMCGLLQTRVAATSSNSSFLLRPSLSPHHAPKWDFFRE